MDKRGLLYIKYRIRPYGTHPCCVLLFCCSISLKKQLLDGVKYARIVLGEMHVKENGERTRKAGRTIRSCCRSDPEWKREERRERVLELSKATGSLQVEMPWKNFSSSKHVSASTTYGHWLGIIHKKHNFSANTVINYSLKLITQLLTEVETWELYTHGSLREYNDRDGVEGS